MLPAKAKDAREEAEGTPLVPPSATVTGEVPPPVKLSVKVADSTVPMAAVGRSTNEIVQDAPPARVPPENELHVVVEVKSLALVPVMVAPEKVIAPLMVFESVATSGALVVFCVMVPKFKLLGKRVTEAGMMTEPAGGITTMKTSARPV